MYRGVRSSGISLNSLGFDRLLIPVVTTAESSPTLFAPRMSVSSWSPIIIALLDPARSIASVNIGG